MLPHPTIALLRTASLPSPAQQEIERMILAGELPPGAKLTEAMLSRAARRLARSDPRGLPRARGSRACVRQEKNRGVFVRDIALDEAAEIYDLRAVMDELAGRRLAVHMTRRAVANAARHRRADGTGSARR